ncbi:MAG: 3-dehydroquinate synthase family protein [Candidatus Cryptobacteroides sp.]
MNKPLCIINTGRTVEDVIPWLKEFPSVYIVADRNVEGYADRVAKALEPCGNLRGRLSINANENAKNMDTVMEICQWLLGLEADRKALVFAIGGGITTDMAGFAASIYKRGVRFAYLPTTFLSQVDAAIGGKTGVNFLNYKNMLGVIRQPEFTFECPEVLSTLPYRDFISGAAELVKTFIIDNAGDNYAKAVKTLSEIAGSQDHQAAVMAHLPELQELISAAAAVKAGVVERDQFESGERRKLNLGHTFAHAIEWLAREKGDDISHGEAVSMGMIMAAGLSEKYYAGERCAAGVPACTKPAGASLQNSLRRDFAACGLPVDCSYSLRELVPAMKYDKKAEGEGVNFVLIRSIGDVRIENLSVNEVLGALS